MKKQSTAPIAIFAMVLITAVLSAPVALARTNIKHLVTIDPPGSIDTRAFGINNKREIVGLYITADMKTRGFLLKGDEYTTIDVPGAIRTNALASTPTARSSDAMTPRIMSCTDTCSVMEFSGPLITPALLGLPS